ncbi:hypothetical protein PR048_017094 [Dryococelus australis]|uniref:Uncharacterized protein n=1 Tax=Dryococelus australis TaxID=614101 RepID=A0ABQ9H8J6_9NEOP|nr:hypothetical protein PR048_017094 [Dryococelus australis]
MWESWWTMPLVGGFSRGPPVSPTSALKTRDKIRSEEIRRQLNIQAIRDWVERRRMEWNQHVSRMASDKTVRVARDNLPVDSLCLCCYVRSIASWLWSLVEGFGRLERKGTRARSTRAGQPPCCDVAVQHIGSHSGMKGRGKMGDPRENPPTSGIVRHDSHVKESGRDTHRESSPVRINGRQVVLTTAPPRLCSSGSRGRGGVVIRLGEPGSICSGVAPGFLRVGIVPDDATGQLVFSGFSSSLSPFHSGTVPYSPHFTLIGSQDHVVKSRPNRFTHSLQEVALRGIHAALYRRAAPSPVVSRFSRVPRTRH